MTNILEKIIEDKKEKLKIIKKIIFLLFNTALLKYLYYIQRYNIS